jgi:thiamine biosynthesis lipoprotein
MSVSFSALGTTVTVATASADALGDAVAAVATELVAIDRACSRFRDDSELAALVGADGRPVRVSPLLLEAVRVALRAARVTDGLVDPTVGRTLRLAGYDATFRVVAGRDGERFEARFDAVPGWQSVEIDERESTVRVPPGVELDLGATAKALAADRSAEAAARHAGSGVLVGLGGDIAVAGAPPAGGWAVGIADDHVTPLTAVDATVAIHSGGLATSSTTVRRWRSGGRTLHHVIDPRTGRPAESPWRTVSVAAASCVDANIASTSAIVLGAAAPAWLDERRLPARLVAADGAVTLVGGWPAERAAA